MILFWLLATRRAIELMAGLCEVPGGSLITRSLVVFGFGSSSAQVCWDRRLYDAGLLPVSRRGLGVGATVRR